MKNILIEYFKKYMDLTTDEIDAITNSTVIREFKKNTFINREGAINLDSYFVLKGLVREFKTVNAEEISTNFYTENQWIINLENNVNLYCLEDTVLIVGNEDKSQKLYERFPRLEGIARQIIENYMAQTQNQLRTYLINSPEERYLKLLEERPELFQRVSQVHLSSYIGVKPESLSRIRKRLLQNRN